MTNPITASRERIVEEIQSDLAENGYACKRCVKDLMELVNPALLQHETVVREEMEKQFRKFQFRYIITGDEIKYCGDPERLSQRKEYLERDLFRQLGDKIRKDGAFTKGFPKAPTDDDIMGEITVIVKMPSKVPRTTQPTI